MQHPSSQVPSLAKCVNVYKTQMEKYKSYRSEKNGEPRNLITESEGTLLKKHDAKFWLYLFDFGWFQGTYRFLKKIATWIL